MIFSADTNRNFRVAYKSFPVSMLRGNERHDVENGGKSKETITDFHPFSHIAHIYSLL